MSILLRDKISRIRDVPYSKFFVVQKESLADFVRITRRDKGLSLMAVRINSGKQLATSYISRIENNEVKNVSPEKLKALAKGLVVSEEILFSLVRGKIADEGSIFQERFQVLAKVYNDLPNQVRSTLDPFLDAFEMTLLNLGDKLHLTPEANKSEKEKSVREKLQSRFIEQPDVEDEEEEIKKPFRRKAS